MTTTYTYMFNLEELSDFADQIKVVVLKRLVIDGLLSEFDADKWAAIHMPIGRKKNVFRTISNLWRDTEETEGHYWMMVSNDSLVQVKTE